MAISASRVSASHILAVCPQRLLLQPSCVPQLPPACLQPNPAAFPAHRETDLVPSKRCGQCLQLDVGIPRNPTATHPWTLSFLAPRPENALTLTTWTRFSVRSLVCFQFPICSCCVLNLLVQVSVNYLSMIKSSKGDRETDRQTGSMQFSLYSA